MGKKNGQKSKVPVETEEQDDRQMEMPPHFPGQDIFKAFKEYAMAFRNAMRRLYQKCAMFFRSVIQRLFTQERGKEMVKDEKKKKKKKKKKKNKEKKKKEKEEEKKKKEEEAKKKEEEEKKRKSEKVEGTEECEMDARNAILKAPSQEEKEKVEHVKETATEFTEEEIYEMLKQCNMDSNLAIQRLLSLEGFEKVKSKRTKKKERFNAQESKSQHEVGSSSGVLKLRESVNDDAGRTDTTRDNTVQVLQEADSNPRSELDNVSSPLAATESSVASQLPSSNIRKGKEKEIDRSSADDTAVISRSHDPPLLVLGPQRSQEPRTGSNPRSFRKKLAGSSRNDSKKFPTALGDSLTTRKGEFSGERSIRGQRTNATVLMPSDPEEQLTPHARACEAPAETFNPNSGGSGTLECELLSTSNDPRNHAEESNTQHKVHSSSSSLVKQGENCDDDAGRTDKTHDNTVHGFQEAGSNGISQLDNVSSPSATAVSSVASQLHSPNIGKVKEVVQSMDDNTAAISRSHISSFPAADPLRLHTSRAGSDHRASRNIVASYSGNDSVMLPPALGGLSTTRNGTGYEFSGERSIWGPWTHATLPMPPEPQKQEIPRQYAREALADARNYNPESSGTSEREPLPTSSEQHGPPYPSQHDFPDQWVAQLLEDHPRESQSRDNPSVRPQFELPEISMLETGPSEDTPINSATSFSHLLREPGGLRSPTLDAPPAPSRMPEHALPEASPTLRCSIQSIQNDLPDLPSSPFHHIDAPSLPMMYSSTMRQSMLSANAPPFVPRSSIHQSSQTLLQGNNLSTGHGFTHPYMEPCYYQPQLALQYNYMNHDGQQDVYQGGISSPANAGPNSWESFPGTQGTLPNSPALSDTSWTRQASAMHLQAQNRNDYCPYGTNFTARYNQPDPRAMSALPQQQQGGLSGWVPPPSDCNNQHGDMPSAQQEVYQGGSSSWASGNASGWGNSQDTGRTCYQSSLIPPNSPAPFGIPWMSTGFTMHRQDQYRIDDYPSIIPGAAVTPHGSFPRSALLPANANNWRGEEGSSPVNGNASGRGSFQSPPIPPYSPAPTIDSWTSNECTLHARYQYRNVHHPLISPGRAMTPHVSFPRTALPPANANNQHRSEGSSPQYDSQGWLSQQRPQTRNRPNHQQQSPYSKTTGNLQVPSSLQPPRDPGL